MEEEKQKVGYLILGTLAGTTVGLLMGNFLGAYSSIENRNLITGLLLVACSTFGAIIGAKREQSSKLRALQREKSPSLRRMLRFSLRTMMVLMTVVCLYLVWAMNWIHQRQAFLATAQRQGNISVDFSGASAPWPIRLLGEQGVSHIEFLYSVPGDEARDAPRLFPEAALGYPDI